MNIKELLITIIISFTFGMSSILFFNNLKDIENKPKKISIYKIIKEPLMVSLDILNISEEKLILRLKQNKLKYNEDLDNIMEIANYNSVSPFKIISILNKNK